MVKSEQINELATALIAFQQEMPSVERSKTVKVGTKYSFDYAPLDHIVEQATPILGKHGLCVSQLVGEGGSVTTLLMHTSGQYIGDTVTITPSSANPQDLGSAITYAKRYSYTSILGIVAEDDDDGNRASGNSYSYGKNGKASGNNKDDGKEWLNKTAYNSDELTPQWQNAVKGIRSGKFTAKDIFGNYKVNKENRAELEQIEKNTNGVPA